MHLDRRAGMPAAHCCWRATARDMLRVLNLLGTDGVHHARPVLPQGWVGEMSRASRVNAGTGMQVARLIIEDDVRNEGLRVSDDNGSAFWVIPRRQLAILNIVSPGGGSLAELPAMLLKGLEATPAN
jgi:CubicO group peptidase (beta-lactamase class C family)